MTAHEDLSIILIQGTLVVTNGWHIFDDHGVVGMLAFLVKDRIGFDHVINNIGLGDLLGTELPLRAEILAVVVSEMVVACNGSKLDPSIDEEINEGRLHLGLSRFKVISANEGSMLLRKLNSTWNESVLWGSIDERNTFQNTSNGKD